MVGLTSRAAFTLITGLALQRKHPLEEHSTPCLTMPPIKMCNIHKHTVLSETTRKISNHWLDEAFLCPFISISHNMDNCVERKSYPLIAQTNMCSQNEQAGMRILGLQCNSLQLSCQNLENWHSESLEDSLLMFSPDYILLRKMNFRGQIGLLINKSSKVIFHLQRFGWWSAKFSDFPDPAFFCSSRAPLSFHSGTSTEGPLPVQNSCVNTKGSNNQV